MRLQRNFKTTRNKVYIPEEYIDIIEIDDDACYIYMNELRHSNYL